MQFISSTGKQTTKPVIMGVYYHDFKVGITAMDTDCNLLAFGFKRFNAERELITCDEVVMFAEKFVDMLNPQFLVVVNHYKGRNNAHKYRFSLRVAQALLTRFRSISIVQSEISMYRLLTEFRVATPPLLRNLIEGRYNDLESQRFPSAMFMHFALAGCIHFNRIFLNNETF